MPYQRPGTKNWWILVHGKGRSAKTTDRATAAALETYHNSLPKTGEPGTGVSAGPVHIGTRHSWQELKREWTALKKDSKVSWRDDVQRMAWFDTYFANVPDVEEITYQWLDAIMRKDRGANPNEKVSANATANRYVSLVRGMIIHAATPEKRRGLGWMDTAPKFIMYPEPDGREMAITPEQWFQLYPELPPHLQDAALAAIGTGLRKQKIFGMQWAQLDSASRSYGFEGTANKAGNVVPINTIVWDRLQQIRSRPVVHHQHVFIYSLSMPRFANVKYRRRCFTSHLPERLKNYGTSWHNALQRVGLGDWNAAGDWEGFCWHGLRHTFATWLLNAGADTWAIEALCGWHVDAKLNAQRTGWGGQKMLNRYAHAHIERLRETAEIASDILLQKNGEQMKNIA